MLKRMKNITLFALFVPAGLFAQNEFDAIHREVEVLDSLVADTAAMDIQTIDADSTLINTFFRFDEGSPTTSTFLGSDATGISAWDSVAFSDLRGTASAAQIPSGGGWVDNGTTLTLATAADSVGVGASPSGQAKFFVSGTLRITGVATFESTITSGAITSTGASSFGATTFGGDIDLTGFDIDNAGFLIINAATAPASTEAYIVRDNTNDVTINVPSGGAINLAIAGTDEVAFTATQMDLTGLNIVNAGTIGSGSITIASGDLALGGGDITGFDVLQTTDATTLTIVTDTITVTQMYHGVTAEAAAVLDSIATIIGGVAGDFLILNAADTDDIFIDVDGGNINGTDRILDGTGDTWFAVFDGTSWTEISFADND